MHLLIRHMELKLPVWLNEGIAEVYSTLRPLAGKVAIGNVPEGLDPRYAGEFGEFLGQISTGVPE